MGRIALFVAVVAGLATVAIRWVTRWWFGSSVSLVTAASLAVILAVILWTLLVARYGERLQAGPEEPEDRD